MKKFLMIVTVLALIMALGITASAAATETVCPQGRVCVDADGDGICDNRGVCGVHGAFVDEDGDGVCDNRGTGSAGQGRRCGGQSAARQGGRRG